MPRTGVKSAAESRIAVSILSPVALHVGGVPVPIPAKQAAVLAMLALDAGRVLSIDRLIDGVWGEDAPRTVRANLQVQVSQLRQAIGRESAAEVIVTRAPGYVLEIEPAAVDALQFGVLLSDARRSLADGDVASAAQSAEAGLRLWTGDPLSGLGDAPFAPPVITRFADQHLDLVEVWADAEIACGRASSVIAPLEHWVSQSPYRETLWQRLILALYRCGRQVDALARLADLRRVLRDEMGVRPCAAIVELETSILDHDISLDAVALPVARERLEGPGRRLPSTKELVGRDELLADITGRCLEHRLVTLVGPGGIGKTSLAVNVASTLAEGYADGVWLVDLSSIADEVFVATTLGAALGLRTGEDDEPIAALVALLRDVELMLVIDNCEHVIDGAAKAIEEILHSCPGVRILATSRERLAVPGETAIPIPALQPVDAVALLAQLALRVGATTASDAVADVASLCAAVDHLPLGIELVAARLQSMSISDIIGQLGSGYLLQLATRTANDRQRTLHSTIQWSYDLLTAPAQTLMRRIAVFDGGATLDAILAVCSDPKGTVGGALVIDALNAAVDASLVTVDRATRQPRYRLLETVKTFAVGRLEAEERSGVCRRHAQEMIAWGQRMRVISDGPDPAQAFESVHAETANLRAAGDYYVSTTDHSQLAKLIGALGPLLWRESGEVEALNSWIDVVLARDDVEPVDRLAVLLVAAFRSGRPTAAERAWAEEALHVANKLTDEASAAFAEFLTGDLIVGELGTDAEPLLRSALARLEATGQWRGAGHALNSYANLLLRMHRLDEAEELLGPRLRSHNSYGASEGFLRYQHARLLLIAGDLNGADVGFDAVMREAVRCGARLQLTYALAGKAFVAEVRGDVSGAREYMERCLVIVQQLGDLREQLGDRQRLVELNVKLGDLDTAREHASIIAELAQLNPEPREIGFCVYTRGLIAGAEGDTATARKYLLDALDVLAPTHLIANVASVIEALLLTLPDSTADQLRGLPADLRKRVVSPMEAVALIEGARQL